MGGWVGDGGGLLIIMDSHCLNFWNFAAVKMTMADYWCLDENYFEAGKKIIIWSDLMASKSANQS